MNKKVVIFFIVFLVVYLGVKYVTNYDAALDIKYEVQMVDNLDETKLVVEDDNYQMIMTLDENNLIVPIYVTVDENSDVVETVFSLFTSKSNTLPLGLRTPIQPSTQLNKYEIDNNVLILDLSEEFLYYNINREQQIITALTQTFSNIFEINKIKILINGKQLSTLNSGYNVSNGIEVSNIYNTYLDCMTINESSVAQVYMFSVNQNEPYLVPVNYIYDKNKDKVEYIFNTITGYNYTSAPVFSHVNPKNYLISYEMQNDHLILNVDESFARYLSNELIVEQLVKSYCANFEVKYLSFEMNGQYIFEGEDSTNVYYRLEDEEIINKI